MIDFRDKRVLVTGATSGLGLAAVQQLAAAGARILLHGRSTDSAMRAADRITAAVPRADVKAAYADLLTYAGVRALAKSAHDFGPIDLLVNNAGAAFRDFALTIDWLERSVAINCHAPLLLTELLLENLAPGAVVATVWSQAAAFVTIAEDDPDVIGRTLAPGYDQLRAYGVSKLLNMLATQSLARQSSAGPVIVLIDPGGVKTSLAEKAGDEKFLNLTRQHWDDCVTAEEAAQQLLNTIGATGLQPGAIYHNGKVAAGPEISKNAALADRIHGAIRAVIATQLQGS